jgi:hypothetical protein
MDSKFWTPVLLVLILAIGSVGAYADSGWRYDEDSDTILFSYSGKPVTRAISHSDTVKHAGTWHYDESSDTIAFTGAGSRSKHVHNNPSTDAFLLDSNLSFLDQ